MVHPARTQPKDSLLITTQAGYHDRLILTTTHHSTHEHFSIPSFLMYCRDFIHCLCFDRIKALLWNLWFGAEYENAWGANAPGLRMAKQSLAFEILSEQRSHRSTQPYQESGSSAFVHIGSCFSANQRTGFSLQRTSFSWTTYYCAWFIGIIAPIPRFVNRLFSFYLFSYHFTYTQMSGSRLSRMW